MDYSIFDTVSYCGVPMVVVDGQDNNNNFAMVGRTKEVVRMDQRKIRPARIVILEKTTVVEGNCMVMRMLGLQLFVGFKEEK